MATIHEAAKERMGQLRAGVPVTNICAGEKNPQRHAYFLRYEVIAHQNKHGIVHTDHWARCGSGGKSWRTGIEVIHFGHLDADECARLFALVWQERYETPTTTTKG